MNVFGTTQCAAMDQPLTSAQEQEPTQFANPSSINKFQCVSSLALSVLSLSAFVTCSLAAPGDENWDGRFGVPGAGEIRSIAVDGNDLYAGGQFGANAAGGGRANYIAKWNGSGGWSPLGTNLIDAVNVVTVSGGYVYAGGVFTMPDPHADALARWDGTNWTALGLGVTNEAFNSAAVNAIVVSGSNLYVGGVFTKAGGVSAARIARWDGSSWSPLGSGLSGGVNAIAVIGNDVYAAGSFTTVGGVTMNSIAKWDGNSWSALGTGVTQSGGTQAGQVFALAVKDGELYVGGFFTAAGGLPNHGLAKWTGTSWAQPGGVGSSGTVRAIAVSGTNIYISGSFTGVGALTPTGGVNATNIARWDGVNWSPLGSGVNGTDYALAVDGDTVYTGGTFSRAGDVLLNSIGKWDSTNWTALGRGFDVSIAAVAVNGTNVFVAGSYSRAGGVAINRVARWNGADWLPLGSGVSAGVSSLAATETNLYVGGNFIMAGGVTVNRVARWDGTNWSALGTGMNSTVFALAALGPDVYAGGTFTTAGGTTVNRIARWDGTNWTSMGSGASITIYALMASGSDLYVGGAFTSISGTNANRIARWNGTSWSALGAGVSGSSVTALAAAGNNLYVGGDFTTAGGNPANRIARWDGNSWSALGSGLNGAVQAIAVSGSDVYVGGTFTTAGGSPAIGIAKWDGSTWSALGSGLTDLTPAIPSYAQTLAIGSGGELYVGGDFDRAGLKPSQFFGIWHPPAPPPFVAGITIVSGNSFVLNWPSQSNGLYQILSTTNLSQPSSPFGSQILATGTNTSYTNAVGADPARFFQIQQLPP